MFNDRFRSDRALEIAEQTEVRSRTGRERSATGRFPADSRRWQIHAECKLRYCQWMTVGLMYRMWFDEPDPEGAT